MHLNIIIIIIIIAVILIDGLQSALYLARYWQLAGGTQVWSVTWLLDSLMYLELGFPIGYLCRALFMVTLWV